MKQIFYILNFFPSIFFLILGIGLVIKPQKVLDIYTSIIPKGNGLGSQLLKINPNLINFTILRIGGFGAIFLGIMGLLVTIEIWD